MQRVARLLAILSLSFPLLGSGCSKPRRSKHAQGTASSKDASRCSGAPSQDDGEEWALYSRSREREEGDALFRYAVEQFGQPVGCSWHSGGQAMDSLVFRDHFSFSFPGGHRLESDSSEQPPKRTVRLDVGEMREEEASAALHKLPGSTSIDWTMPVHGKPRKDGLIRTAWFQDGGKCSVGFYSKAPQKVVRLETECGG
jgi:hypothetical protein